MKSESRRPDGSTRVATINTEPSKTAPEFQEQCDVNFIMKKYRTTGQVTHIAKRPGFYADLSDLPTYQDSLDLVRRAQDSFNDLPAHIRKRFGNDPQNLLEFIQDPQNRDEAIKLGLMTEIPQLPQETTEPPKQKQNSKSKTNEAPKQQNDAEEP